MKAKSTKKATKEAAHHKTAPHTHHRTGKKSSTAVGTIGVVLAVVAVGVSLYGTMRASSADSVLARGTGIFLGTLILRVLALKLSSRMLSVKTATWGHSIAVVGANAVFLTALTLIGSIAGLSGMYFGAALVVLMAFFGIVVAREVLRITVLEALSLYALSLAFLVVAFAVIALVFHPALGSLLGGA